MTKIPTRDEFAGLAYVFREKLWDVTESAIRVACQKQRAADDAHLPLLAAYDEMIERIVELEAQCDTMGTALLGRGCDGVVHECAVLEARIAELEGVATCDHGEDAAVEWIPAFKNAEIYRCGCGVLLDINNPMQAMTVEEICAAVRGEGEGRIAALKDALTWMVNLAHGVGKGGGPPEPGEFEAATETGKAALARTDRA